MKELPSLFRFLTSIYDSTYGPEPKLHDADIKGGNTQLCLSKGYIKQIGKRFDKRSFAGIHVELTLHGLWILFLYNKGLLTK
jgi:hypothetical protein